MASKRRAYVNRSKSAVKVGDVVIVPGATVALNEAQWAEADEQAGLYRDFRETVEQIVELVN